MHENFHTKHSVLTVPDEHIPYIIQLHDMSKIRSRTSDQFIRLVSEKKTEAVNAYVIKNSKGEGQRKKERKKRKEKRKKRGRGGGRLID